MQSSIVVWTPTKSSSAIDVVSEDLSAANDNFVTRTLLTSSSSSAEEGLSEASSRDLAAMQACYVQLKQLVPTVPLNGELSSLQLLQHVIDYIGDLELALHSSATSSPQRRHHQHQQLETSACHSQTTTTQCNSQRQSVSAVSSADGRNTSSCDNCSTTSELACNISPLSTSHILRDTELLSSSHV